MFFLEHVIAQMETIYIVQHQSRKKNKKSMMKNIEIFEKISLFNNNFKLINKARNH